MGRRIIEEFVIPKCTGKAFRLDSGQLLRVIQHEGKQVAGLIFLNAHNYKEQFMAEFSGGLNYFHPDRPGSHYRLGRLYSKVPYENEMLAVTENPIGDHFLGPHCTPTTMELLGVPGHRSCSDNFSEALREFGLELEDIYSPSVLHAFANVRIETGGDGRILIEPPRSTVGDFIELQAEMDVLAVISTCPDDQTPMNDHECKAVKVQILE
jgi:uncharacterized protein YcgI (DUF1989 family)